MASVAVVGGSEETRLLLRGLLRLHGHQVVGEGAAFAEILPRDSAAEGPTTVVADVDLDDPETGRTLAAIRRARPSLRIVLLTPHRSARVEAKARELGLAGILRRPFAVRELMEAVEGRPGALPPSPTPRHP